MTIRKHSHEDHELEGKARRSQLVWTLIVALAVMAAAFYQFHSPRSPFISQGQALMTVNRGLAGLTGPSAQPAPVVLNATIEEEPRNPSMPEEATDVSQGYPIEVPSSLARK